MFSVSWYWDDSGQMSEFLNESLSCVGFHSLLFFVALPADEGHSQTEKESW